MSIHSPISARPQARNSRVSSPGRLEEVRRGAGLRAAGFRAGGLRVVGVRDELDREPLVGRFAVVERAGAARLVAGRGEVLVATLGA
jgi:hypothetical protein